MALVIARSSSSPLHFIPRLPWVSNDRFEPPPVLSRAVHGKRFEYRDNGYKLLMESYKVSYKVLDSDGYFS